MQRFWRLLQTLSPQEVAEAVVDLGAAVSRDTVRWAAFVAPASRDAVPWVWAAFEPLLSDALAGAVAYVRVGVEYVRVGVWLLSDAPVGVGAAAGAEAGVEVGAVGDGPLRLASRSVSLRPILGAGATTVRNGTAFNG